MASSLVVDVCEIDAVQPHPNAENLELVQVKGWQAVVPKGRYVAGDKVVYMPPDTMMPRFVSDSLGVTNYLKGGDEKRVGQIRLRGEASFGLVIDLPKGLSDASVGDDIGWYYGASKYEPPVLGQQGDALGYEHPLFTRYTDIENLRNYPSAFQQGETVYVTEKVHGTNVRVGKIGEEIFAGSHRLARMRPLDREDMANNWYWYPYTISGVQKLLDTLANSYSAQQVILYGETYGAVQSLHYGLNGGIAFRAFDILVDGNFLDYQDFMQHCSDCDVPIVPLVAKCSFGIDQIAELSCGKSLVEGADHIREGVVIRPVQEQHSEVLNGRLVAKYISDDYLLSKNQEKDTQDV